MKFKPLYLLFFFIVSCGNDQVDVQQSNNVQTEISTQNPDQISNEPNENEIEGGSQKEMLLGNWQAADDPELMIEISPTKYRTFINGKKNWDNPWDLSNSLEYSPELESDNGKFVLVHLEDKSAVFYAQEILSLTENKLDVVIMKSSAGTGMTQTFIRN